MKYKTLVARQPQTTAASLVAVRRALTTMHIELPKGGRIVFCGIGASYSVALTAAEQARRDGWVALSLQPTDLEGASMPIDLLVLISGSGRSVELLQVARAYGPVPTISLSRQIDNPLAKLCSYPIGYDSGEDATPNSTGYTGALLACGLLLSHLNGQDENALWDAIPRQIGELLENETIWRADFGRFTPAPIMFDFVGAASFGTALGASLMLREAARLFTAEFNTRHYLHGPMEVMDQRTAVVLFGDGREVEIASFLETIGCRTLLVTSRADVQPSDLRLVARVPEHGNALARALVDIVPAQVLASSLSDQLGLTDVAFRYRQTDTKDRTGL